MTQSPSDGAAAAPKPRPELRAIETAPAESGAAGRAEAARAEPAATAAAARAARKAERRRAAKAPASEAAPAAKPAATRRAAAKPAARPAAKPRRARRVAPPPTPELAAALAAAASAPEVRPARLMPRHWLVLLSFLLIVLLPFAATVGYLYTRAADRYHSDVAFSIRSEETSSATAGLLGAITNIGSGSASDADILYEYVRSQDIVEAVDAELDLRAVWSRPEGDPVFTVAPDASIEDLVAHWRSMVDISFESATGIITARAQAFTSEDAHAIAEAILEQSSALVNELSDQARADAIRFAQEEFAEAEENLRVMRARLSAFRRENRIVDPSGDVAGQTGLLNALQTELAQALVERDMLLSYVGEGTSG